MAEMLETATYILPNSGWEGSCLNILVGPQRQELQKRNGFLGVGFPKAHDSQLQQGWKIHLVSTPAISALICLCLAVFSEVSTPQPDLG